MKDYNSHIQSSGEKKKKSHQNSRTGFPFKADAAGLQLLSQLYYILQLYSYLLQ